jgi:hypothetical protein
MKGTALPVRRVRFIKGRRLEFNAAKKVLEIELKKEIDPIVVEAKQKHYTKLAEVADSLLANDLLSVRQNLAPEAESEREYLIADPGFGTKTISKSTLKNRFMMNFGHAKDQYGSELLNCFIAHFQNEFGNVKPFTDWINDDPYDIISKCVTLDNRRTFKENCSVCKEI